jgi:transcription elongation GreA/GreB family factor
MTKISKRLSGAFCVFAVVFLASQLRGAPPNPQSAMPWTRIVMVGASVTAGFTLSEPLGGPRTAQCDLSRYLGAALTGPHQPVRNLGNTLFFMQPDYIGKQQIQTALQTNPTLLTGIDFLFWFCYGRVDHEEDRAQRFEQGLKLLEAVRCPLILGDIPDASAAVGSMLSADEIPSASALAAANRRLREWAKTHPMTVVVPLARLMRTIQAGKTVMLHHHALPSDQTHPLLQADRLHPTPRGCAVLAIAVLDAFQSSRFGLSTAEIDWNPSEVFRQVSRKNE